MWSNIPGWTGGGLEEFYRFLATEIPKGGKFLEVGTFLGRSIALMGELRPDLDLWCVDPWLDGESRGYTGPAEHSEHAKDGLFFGFLDCMRAQAPDVLSRLHIVRGTAETVMLDVDFDAVFIDGAHDFESVKLDIARFGMLVREGGIMAGHDYHPDFVPSPDDGREGVIRAVNEVCTPEIMGTCWWVRC